MGGKTVTEQILSYIESHLDKELTLEKIAKELSYSKFYLSRQFKRNTGVTLHKYIQGRRLAEAAEKLVKTRKPIMEIAFEAGYSSQQAFTKAFCHEFMCTPQKYRKDRVLTQIQNKTCMKRKGRSESNLYQFMKGRAAA